jgi:ubiquinone/menaquinone biosynthesis C-methylase UbiE
MTPDMLERARATAEKRSITNVDFRQGFAENLPVEDAVVDVVISNCVINLTEDKGRAFEEAARVLKPGGRLEISDVVLSGALPFDFRENIDGWAECVTGALPEREYLDLVSQAGFVDIKIKRSRSDGRLADVSVYSAIVSARKPTGGA